MQSMKPTKVALAGLVFLGLVNLARGSIHFFAPDGGLTSIAGLDLSTERATILFFIGAVGGGQIAFGLLDLLVAWRHRNMVLPLLVIHLIEMAFGLFLFFVWRPLPVVVPGQVGAVFSFVVFGLITVREFLHERRDVEG
ncbi:MAG: hypothetical protein K8R18_15095 [Parvibaculum sp.]|uniref:hypothetical protein n=1 Tax=Parvibaculum sp. TaxID=2024848 RepID=UPI0025F19A83|nr:hypothetical protein [Parvibaculum sp.]MCE9650944.1 hypothetical protein [Parvibaculum sp.]